MPASTTDFRTMDYGHDVHLDRDGNPRIIERRFVVPPELAGVRLDHFLREQIPRLSRTRLQRIIRSADFAHAGGRPLRANTRVVAGDEFILRRPAQPEPPCPRHFEVLYEDEDLLVIDKPAGLPVHASAKFYFNTLTRVLFERYPDRPLQIAHRIDRETSGCLVVAANKRAAAALKGAFGRKLARKSYLAIVHGNPDWPAGGAERSPDEHAIDLPLALVSPAPGRILVRMSVQPDGLPSITRVSVLERGANCALIRCRPITGRQHQIRAHLAAVGHPIVGDKLYAHGDEAFADYCQRGLTADLLERFELPRQALHAASIEIPHPSRPETVAVESPLPLDLRAYLDRAAALIPIDRHSDVA